MGRELAPLPYPWLAVIGAIGAAIILVALAPPHHLLFWRFAYMVLAMGVLALAIHATGLVRLPADWRRRLMGQP